MRFDMQLMGPVVLALLTALVVSFLMTPVVKSFAYKVGAIDVPKDARRMHHKPIPRLGGLAIFAGFMVSILLFVDIRLNPRCRAFCWARSSLLCWVWWMILWRCRRS